MERMNPSINKKSLRGGLLLTLTAFIWGTAFAAQSMGMEHLGPFSFNGIRTLLGGVVLLPVILLRERRAGEIPPAGERSRGKKLCFAGGAVCGVILFAASSLQQVGLQYTTAGKAGFLTALYIVIVPILGIFFRERAGVRVWVSVAIALAGAYLLSVKEELTIGAGDACMLVCAVLFSFHILSVGYFSRRVDPIKLSCVQFFISGLIGTLTGIFLEGPDPGGVLAAWGPILYAGVLSSGVAYTLQAVGQRDTHPAVASLIMSLESVFAALAGWAVLGERLSPRELLGCCLVFLAVILAQLPPFGRRRPASPGEKIFTENPEEENPPVEEPPAGGA